MQSTLLAMRKLSSEHNDIEKQEAIAAMGAVVAMAILHKVCKAS